MPALSKKQILFFSLSIPALIVPQVSAQESSENYNSGWQLTIENNILTRYMKDRDYTGGIAFTASGTRAKEGWLNIDPLRAWIFDPLLDKNNAQTKDKNTDIKKHAVQYGFLAFTPDDITSSQPILDDRPFASLFYISNTQLYIHPATDRAFRSSLSFGLLGLDLAGEIQQFLHKTTGSDAANGWDYQISSGGEPTAMLTLSVQDKQIQSDTHQLSTHLEANLGYSTDINAGINWRWGRLTTPWWSFNPSHREYISSAESSVRGSKNNELYFFAMANIKYRAYSSLLQGQFRSSVHTLGFSEIEQVLGSVSTGIVSSLGDSYRISFSVNGNSPEIKGSHSRNLWWASLSLNRNW